MRHESEQHMSTEKQAKNKSRARSSRRGEKPEVAGTTWPKGTSGNPKGRPKKGTSWAEVMRAKGDEVIDEATGRTRRDALADVAYLLANGGDTQALKLIMDREEGTARQSIDTTHHNAAPSKIEITVVDKSADAVKQDSTDA